MKATQFFLGLFFLLTLISSNISAQKTGDKVPKIPARCTSTANQIYFVASGQSVTEVRPGSNGGNGYQLNILGVNVDKFEVIQEKYMTSLSVIPNYTNETAAKWQIFFAARQGQRISTIRMKSKCGTREIKTYQLTESVMLLDQ